MWVRFPPPPRNKGRSPDRGTVSGPKCPDGAERHGEEMTLLKQEVQVRFERIVKDQHGNPGKVHVTLNGAPVCETWTRKRFRQHPSGVEQVDFATFLSDACGTKTRKGNGEVLTFGCVPEMERGLKAKVEAA